jgi:hypothetical protein
MSAKDEELVPLIIAAIVMAIGAFCLWSELRGDSLGHEDGMITSGPMSQARPIVAPSEQPAHLTASRTVHAFEPSTVTRETP